MSNGPEIPSFARKWGSLLIMSLALAIIVIDTTLLNVSLGTIIRELKTTIQSLQWVISAYSLTLAALTVTGGRLGDLFGRKKMFMTGAVLFAIGSFIASISQTVGWLIVGESIIEGVGAALMMPATSSLLVANFKGKERAMAFGVWGGIAAASSAIGPILGGWLTTNYSWRWGFRINVVVVVLLLIGSVLIQESKDNRSKGGLDWGGVVLSAAGLFSLVFGIIESSTYGWWKASQDFMLGDTTIALRGLSIVPVFLLAGVILLVLFALYERRREQVGHIPLVSHSLFQNRQFTSGATTTMVMSLGLAGTVFAVPVFLQAVRGFDALHTGLALLPLSGTLLIVSPAAAILVTKFPAKRVIQSGLGITVVAMFLLYTELIPTASALDLAPGLAMYGMGIGLVMAQINNVTLSAVGVEAAGEASGVNNTFRQLGSSLGSAILGAILLTTLSSGIQTKIQASKVIPETGKATLITKITDQSTSFQLGGNQDAASPLPLAVKEEVVRISHESTAEGNRLDLLYVAGFMLLGVLVSLYLPATSNFEKKPSAGH